MLHPFDGTAARPPARRGGVTSSIPGGPLLIVGAIVVVVIAAAFLLLRRGGGAGAGRPARCLDADGDCPTSQPPALPAGETRTVTLNTPKGAIVIQVEADLSPIAAGNFVALAGCGFYDGTVFHRRRPEPFVIQGGDPTGTGTGGPGYTIKDEPVTTTYSRATVAMARSSGAGFRRLPVLHRPRRRGALGARRPEVQQLPDHRGGHLGDGGGRCDRRGRRRGREPGRPGPDHDSDRRQPVAQRQTRRPRP